jgi:hypothetical protein
MHEKYVANAERNFNSRGRVLALLVADRLGISPLSLEGGAADGLGSDASPLLDNYRALNEALERKNKVGHPGGSIRNVLRGVLICFSFPAEDPADPKYFPLDSHPMGGSASPSSLLSDKSQEWLDTTSAKSAVLHRFNKSP